MNENVLFSESFFTLSPRHSSGSNNNNSDPYCTSTNVFAQYGPNRPSFETDGNFQPSWRSVVTQNLREPHTPFNQQTVDWWRDDYSKGDQKPANDMKKNNQNPFSNVDNASCSYNKNEQSTSSNQGNKNNAQSYQNTNYRTKKSKSRRTKKYDNDDEYVMITKDGKIDYDFEYTGVAKEGSTMVSFNSLPKDFFDKI